MGQTNSSHKIGSDETLFDIIEFLEENGETGVTELADNVDISQSTAHAHLVTLSERGYVVNQQGRYRLSLRFLDLGVQLRKRKVIYPASIPKLKVLAAKSHETARCVVEENGLGIFLAEETGKHSVKTDARVGFQTNLHVISSGKAILAHLPEERVWEIIGEHGLPKQTEHTITDPDELFGELETIRERGYALNLQESTKGVHAVGAPVLDRSQHVLGAITIFGAANRLTEEHCREFSSEVLAAANEIELDLTYSE